MNKQETKKYQNFTVSLALFDALPVVFFCIGMFLIASRFHNLFFFIGTILCILAGCGKVLWKILVALKKWDIQFLNKQLRILMPLGFLLVIIGLINGRNSIHFTNLIHQMMIFPTCLFFGITIIGMICMNLFAFMLDGTKAKSNWIEQITNAIAQGCFLLGVLSMLF
ncbi:MAG: hypothetical protein Q4Q31_05205 [Bacillota bacterium]|nr:hypothetical protein [Bacillota bacterium]